jgi:hypothetical protein
MKYKIFGHAVRPLNFCRLEYTNIWKCSHISQLPQTSTLPIPTLHQFCSLSLSLSTVLFQHVTWEWGAPWPQRSDIMWYLKTLGMALQCQPLSLATQQQQQQRPGGTSRSNISCTRFEGGLRNFSVFLTAVTIRITVLSSGIGPRVPRQAHLTNVSVDFRLPPLCEWDIRSSWMLRCVDW